MTAHEFRTTRGGALWQGLALLLIVLAAVATAPSGALAAEEERLTYEQLQQTSSQRAQEFFPEAYEEPSFFRWLSIPVLLAGLVMVGAWAKASTKCGLATKQAARQPLKRARARPISE